MEQRGRKCKRIKSSETIVTLAGTLQKRPQLSRRPEAAGSVTTVVVVLPVASALASVRGGSGGSSRRDGRGGGSSGASSSSCSRISPSGRNRERSRDDLAEQAVDVCGVEEADTSVTSIDRRSTSSLVGVGLRVELVRDVLRGD